jgi:hypothetical protein
VHKVYAKDWAEEIQQLFRQAKMDGVFFYTPDYGDDVQWFRSAYESGDQIVEGGSIDIAMRDLDAQA